MSGAKSSRNLSEAEAAGTTDNDDLILKRMEEILMTYKSKVEDHLAAEGRELPKEIFEDFTSRWVQNQAQVRLVENENVVSRKFHVHIDRALSDSCKILLKVIFNFSHRLLQSRPLSPSQGPMVAWQPQIPPQSIRSGPRQMASMFGLHRLCAKKDETGPTEPGYPCPLITQATSMEMSEIEHLYSASRHF